MAGIKDIQRFLDGQQGTADYLSIFEKIQNIMKDKLYELHSADLTKADLREKELAFIIRGLDDRRLRYVEDGTELSSLQLAEKIYADMEEYGVLTKPLKDENVEGININSWRDIVVDYAGGESRRIQSFASPEQAQTILERLLQTSKVQFDAAIPTAEASVGSNIRVTAVRPPVVTEEIAVAAYIRILRKKIFSIDEYVEGGFADVREVELIRTAVRRGVSVLFVGKVNTGKTSLAKAILYGLPDELKVITIEAGAREMDLLRRAEDGKAQNNVVHMLTREDPDERRNVTQEKLLVKTLRLNPDVVSVAEMRDVEAYAAQEASLSGHPVITTAHAGSIKQGHRRVASLCRKAYPTDYQEAIHNACEAFPLVCFIHLGEDGRRRIMNLTECYITDDEQIIYHPLWEYHIKSNHTASGGHILIDGEHRQIGNPSAALIDRMKLYGITDQELAAIQMPLSIRVRQKEGKAE